MNTNRKTLFRVVFSTLMILAAAYCSVLWAQDCVPNDITLNAQLDVDSFQANHGPCDRLRNLYIQGADITNLDGLSALTTVDGELAVQDNIALTGLGGLSALTSIVGNALIQNNTVLTSMDGLSSLKSVGAELTISNNAALRDLEGLSALQWVRSLWVFGNSTLANCRGLVTLIDRVDDYDPGPGNPKSIYPDVEWDANFSQNLPRCNSVTEVLVDASLTEMPNCTPWSIYLGTQAEIDNFQASHGPCDRVGMLQITGEDIVNLDGLSALIKVGALDIEYNPLLTLVNGLGALTNVDAWLVIRGNEKLSTLDGLSGITSTSDNILIWSNLSLRNVDGLSGLNRVGGTLSLKYNAVLDHLDGLSKVTSVGGLDISLNGRLRNLDGLSGITHVGGDLQIYGSESFTNLDGLSNIVSVGGDLYIWTNPTLAQCSALSKLLDQWDDAEPGPGPGVGGIPDIGGKVTVENNLSGCNSILEIMATVNPSRINPGLNDAWYDPDTNGQGFFITVLPDLSAMSLAWFTYDTELPSLDAVANLGDPSHRWITAVGPIVGNQVMMDIELTSGGLFDSYTDIIRTDPPGSDGTITVTFDSCNSGTVEYDIPSINRQGTVPIKRVANDNIVLCEVLNAN
jgi:hypothetical protein